MVPRGSSSVSFGIPGTVPGSPSTCGLGTGDGISGGGFEGLGEGGLGEGGGLGTGTGGGGLGLDTSMVSLHIRTINSDDGSFTTLYIIRNKSPKILEARACRMIAAFAPKPTEIERWQGWSGRGKIDL